MAFTMLLAAALGAQTGPPAAQEPPSRFIVCPGNPRCPRARPRQDRRREQPNQPAISGGVPRPEASPPAEVHIPATKTVYFAVNGVALDERAREILDAVAQWLHFNPTIMVTIEGHADARGSSGYNRALAARRAGAVRDWLVHRGILASRLTTLSFGEDRPALYDEGESVWMMNRRVEIRTR